MPLPTCGAASPAPPCPACLTGCPAVCCHCQHELQALLCPVPALPLPCPRPAGFCILHDLAVTAELLLRQGRVGRVLILDLDVHQACAQQAQQAQHGMHSRRSMACTAGAAGHMACAACTTCTWHVLHCIAVFCRGFAARRQCAYIRCILKHGSACHPITQLQGDGTAAIFQGRQDVFTLSVHADSNFPARKQVGGQAAQAGAPAWGLPAVLALWLAKRDGRSMCCSGCCPRRPVTWTLRCQTAQQTMSISGGSHVQLICTSSRSYRSCRA